MANGLRLCLACVGLVLLVACQFPFSPTPTPTRHGSDAEIELVSGKAWARPAGASAGDGADIPMPQLGHVPFRPAL